MAANFKIFHRKKKSSLELRLKGDFDGTSACELLKMLGQKQGHLFTVLINTGGLKAIFPFGVDTFRNNLHVLKRRPIQLVFTGRNAAAIAPEGNHFLRISFL
jgi:hypothetical protein